MTAFDRKLGHIIVRVVYDGPAGAGKTENLKRLVETFTSQRRGELMSPGEREGSTSYFDWLYLNGGVVAGHPLRAQLVTVPGRSVLTRRRWQVVKTADVIVFVCESTVRGAKEARRWLELLRANLAASDPPPPIVVQANKQDLPGALDREELASALGLPSDGEVVVASAVSGAGVRDTVVRAIRAAAGLAERELLEKGVDGMTEAEESNELLAQLDGSAQMRAAITLTDVELPPFPDEDVASGCVWPGTTGRAVLRSLARALATGVRLLDDRGSAVVLRAGDLRLETSRAHRFDDLAAGRTALLDHARARVRLGALNAPDTTLVLATGDGGTAWLWTLVPWTPPLSDVMAQADARGDEDALGKALRAYARASVEALTLAVRDGVLIHGGAAHFGALPDRVVYLSDWIRIGEGTDAILRDVVDVARAYQHRTRALRDYIAALGATLAESPMGPPIQGQVGEALARAGHTLAPSRRSADIA